MSACAHNAEISSTDLRRGAAFDNVKASWNQALKLGDFNTKLRAGYDYNANRDFLKEVSLQGDLVEASKDDDVSVSYEVTHDFADKNTNVKLTANTQGTRLGAEYDRADGFKEVSAERDVDVGDQKINVQPSWLVQAKTARVKLMSRLNGGDQVSAQVRRAPRSPPPIGAFSRGWRLFLRARSFFGPVRRALTCARVRRRPCAQVDYNTNGGDIAYEVGYDHNLEDGRDISATVKPGSKEVEVDYVDNKFEKGATWTASATVPLENSGSSNILDAAKLSLKRSWQW